MTTPPTPPRAQRLGVLGVAFYALLSPSGKIISGAAAATLLVGGLVTQLRPPSPPATQAPAPTPVVPTHLAHSGSSAPVFTYIEVDGQTLPVVLTENPTSNGSVGHGPASATPSLGLSGGGGRGSASASPSIYPSGGGGRGPGAGSSHSGPRPGSPSPGPGGLPPKASQPDATPAPPPTTGHIPLAHLASSGDPADNESSDAGLPPPQGERRNESRESSGNVPGSPSEAPGLQLPPENEAGAPKNQPLEPPESEFPTGTDDPLNPSILLSETEPLLTSSPVDDQSLPQIAAAVPEPSVIGLMTDDPLDPSILLSNKTGPLLTLSPVDDQSLPQIAAAVPEPSVIALILLGLAALGWTGRRRLTPARRA